MVALISMVALVLAIGASSAFAEASPWWKLTSRMVPTRLAPGGEATIIVSADNLGDAPTTNSEAGKYEIRANLPKGFKLEQAQFFATGPFERRADLGPSGPFAEYGFCQQTSSSVTCASEGTFFKSGLPLNPVAPYDFLELRLRVKDEGAASGELNETVVSGGGAANLTLRRSIEIGTGKIPFGLEHFDLIPEEEGGGADIHAGSHPFQLTSTLAFNSENGETLKPIAMPRNLQFKLPTGQIGNPTAVAQCSDQDFAHMQIGGVNLCHANTVIGVANVTLSILNREESHFLVPVFNLVPTPGEPARFGFEVLRGPVILDTSIRSGAGEDYGVTVSASNITQVVNFMESVVTFWGAPSDPRHNESRGWACLDEGFWAKGGEVSEECQPSRDPHPTPFLTLPTNCETPYSTPVEGASWPTKAAPGGYTLPETSYTLADGEGDQLKLAGCNALSFAPTMTAFPTAVSASSPSGLNVNLDFNDEGLISENGTAQSQLKDTTVVLPEGLTINPSAGVGLAGCTPADFARETLESEPGTGCPNNSKLGTVTIETPLLAPGTKINGSVFIAQPFDNPFSSLIALYIVAKNPTDGVLIKLSGQVTPDPATGRLTTTFKNTPQLPFSHFNFHFREGQQAPLITPVACGSYPITAQAAPWSEPAGVANLSSSFMIEQGSGGGACPAGGAPPFAPQIQSGLSSNSAGAFSAFDLRLFRGDGESEISTFSTKLPPGLIGVLTGIPYCPEADIALARTKTGVQEEQNPSCPAASQLGHSLVGTGVGAVLAYTPGRLYLAGPYNGDPFSLVSVTSAVVGPFDLGTVVIRFGLRIDPHTAQVSVDPTASEPIPRIIDGIVTHVRDIRVYVDRPNFTLNPTSCEPTGISSTLTSSLAQSSTVSSPFQAASCTTLKFTPTVATTTSAKSSKANGTSLVFKIAYPKGPLGTQSWFNEAKFDLPKQLPARLTTIQKACLATVFETNRAACPSASLIGHAVVRTQVLPVPLEGPVYFVSHGGAKFPDAVIVLHGDGVAVELVGETFIDSKTGVTSATFRNTPDVPFESIEVTLPSGPFSEFGANLPEKAKGSFCGQKLVMPTLFKAQNGLEIHRNVPVGVTGCAKAKTRAQLLAEALKACHRKRKGKRAACARAARRRYGAKASSRSHKTHR